MKKALVLLGTLFVLSSALFAAPAPVEISPANPAVAAPVEPLFLTACQISKDCPCGDSFITISCTGNVSCTSNALSITCDGHRYSCTMVDCNPMGGGGN